MSEATGVPRLNVLVPTPSTVSSLIYTYVSQGRQCTTSRLFGENRLNMHGPRSGLVVSRDTVDPKMNLTPLWTCGCSSMVARATGVLAEATPYRIPTSTPTPTHIFHI